MNGEHRSKIVWTITGLAVALVLVTGTWFGRPAYHRFKERRSLAQARQFLKGGDHRNAVLALRQTLALNAANIEATRLMAELAGETQSPGALALWRRVVELSPTFDNKILLAAMGLRVEKPPFPIATQTIEELRSLGETNTAYHLVASQLAIKLNRLADAVAHLQMAVQLQPTNRLHQLNLATLQLQSSDAAVANTARKELTALVADQVLGEHALRSLTANALLHEQADVALDYSQQLLVLPSATFADHLQHLTVLQATASTNLSAWLWRVQQEAATNVLRITQTISWMSGHGQAKSALDWLATLPPTMRNTMPIPLVEADCFVATRDWPGLEARLNDQQWDEQEFIRLALLSHALRGQRQNEVADVIWRRAVNTAAARVELTSALAQIAMGWGQNNEAEDLLWTAAKRAPNEDWPLRALVRSYSTTSNTMGMYRVHQALLDRYPKSEPLKNNVAMFALLLNRDLPRATELARELYEAGPTNAIFVSTYAYALHVQGHSVEGLKLLHTLPATELQRPEIALYYAVLLSANGDREKAKIFVAAAEQSPMLPEERRLLAEVR